MSSSGTDIDTDTGPGPELLSRGQYSLYRSPDGGLHLAYRAEGMDDDAHLVMPPAMVRMAQAAADGKGPFGRLQAMFSREKIAWDQLGDGG